MARVNCERASNGNAVPVCFSTTATKASPILRRAGPSRSAIVLPPASLISGAAAFAKASEGMSQTVLPNISMKRRYESQANRESPVIDSSVAATSCDMPTLRTVSIIPGIENFAPDRTETKSGFFGSPNDLPIFFSRSIIALSISFKRSALNPPVRKYSWHARVVIVNPSGTGMPKVAISARLAPLPPKRSDMVRLPALNG